MKTATKPQTQHNQSYRTDVQTVVDAGVTAESAVVGQGDVVQLHEQVVQPHYPRLLRHGVWARRPNPPVLRYRTDRGIGRKRRSDCVYQTVISVPMTIRMAGQVKQQANLHNLSIAAWVRYAVRYFGQTVTRRGLARTLEIRGLK